MARHSGEQTRETETGDMKLRLTETPNGLLFDSLLNKIISAMQTQP